MYNSIKKIATTISVAYPYNTFAFAKDHGINFYTSFFESQLETELNCGFKKDLKSIINILNLIENTNGNIKNISKSYADKYLKISAEFSNIEDSSSFLKAVNEQSSFKNVD